MAQIVPIAKRAAVAKSVPRRLSFHSVACLAYFRDAENGTVPEMIAWFATRGFAVKVPTIYEVVKLLVQYRYIEEADVRRASSTGKPRVTYRITENGATFLREYKSSLLAILALL